MSPYLHFGQISPLYLALRVARTQKGTKDNAATYLEELIIRRELSMNFVEFTPNYDSFDCLPEWAKKTLTKRSRDRREHRHSAKQLERAETHPILECRVRGNEAHRVYMHSYMRMYWAKKILEWSRSPEAAFRITLAIMNKYFLDGRDANSYAGVAWVYGNHDRPFFDRKVFGRVRYMSASGLERKADMDAYLRKVAALADPA